MLSRILYEDKEVLVVHKPAGIAVQTARIGQADVVSELKNYLCQGGGGFRMAAERQEPYLGILHRLDQPVEGLLVFAKTRRSAAFLTEQLRKQCGEGDFCKHYYAVLCGVPGKREGRLEDWLYKQPVKNGRHTDYIAIIDKKASMEILDFVDGSGCPGSFGGSEQGCSGNFGGSEERGCLGNFGGSESRGCPVSQRGKRTDCQVATGDSNPGIKSRPGDRQGFAATAEEPKSCRAVLEYRILQTREEQGLALADIRIRTGRFHQIRAQMAHAGTPLLGDQKYGSEESKALARALGVRSTALCAYRLKFIHPVSRERLDFRVKPENPAFSSFSQL